MTQLYKIIKELCPNGVERKKIKDEYIRLRGTPITAGKMKEIENSNGDIKIFAGGKTVINAFEKDIPNANITRVPAVLVQSRGVIDAVYYDKPFTFKNEMWAYTAENVVSVKYLYYVLKNNMDYFRSAASGMGSLPQISLGVTEDFQIPVPPIPVQEEIVRILDSFTELTVELTAELTARKKQYEYYCNELLDIRKTDVVFKTLGELSKFRRGSFPQPYGNAEWYDGEGAMPFVQVADIGEDMRLVADTKRKISTIAQPKSVFAPSGSIIISLQGSIGRIAVTQYDAYIDRTVAIFQDISKEILPKYFVYQLQRIFAIKEKTARGSTIKTITKEEFASFSIAVPPIDEQQRIVDVLDKFHNLCHDISEGLPAEIEARTKQYEYYRDKLLSFKEKS